MLTVNSREANGSMTEGGVVVTFSAIGHAGEHASFNLDNVVEAWPDSDALASEVRQTVPLATRKRHGQFFTSEDLVAKIWAPILSTLTPTSVVVDPACGSGNLLIPAVRFLAAQYGPVVAAEQFRGHDLVQAFATRTRHRLEALVGAELPEDSFTSRDFLDGTTSWVHDASHVVMNPPYVMIERPSSAGSWANRRVNAAAVFVAAALAEMTDGAHLVAILPDVLRSGSSYEDWRCLVASSTSSLAISKLGTFDTHTDIDVFALHAVVGRAGANTLEAWNNNSRTAPETVSTHFDVRVGSVVPHRTPPTAPLTPFVTARSVKPWATVEHIDTRGPASSRLDRGPFVVVRRTSSPQDSERVRASVVADLREIAVENHLLVLTPRDGTLAKCNDLVAVLQDERTNVYMNETIRCRHLTVGSVANIPWWSVTNGVDL